MEKNLIEWFNKTGYPLELFAESILSKFEYITTSSAMYKDRENKIFRELDLEATKGWSTSEDKIELLVNLLIECKSTKKPFILLKNKIPKKNKRLSIGSYIEFGHPNCFLATSSPNHILDLPNRSSSGFKLIQGFTDSDETIHKAVNTLTKSYIDFLKREEDLLEDYKNSNTLSITFPILLIDAPFFELKIDENNEIKLDVIDSGVLHSLTHSRKPFLEEFPIAIIRKESFGDFLKNIEDFGLKNLQFLINNPDMQAKNYDISKFVFVPKEK
jgi:hypothetical protein